MTRSPRDLKEIDGDIIADDSYYPYDPYPPGWSVGDLYFTFGAPVSAIAFNDNSITVEVSPGLRVGDPAVVAVEPAAATGTFGHELTTGAAEGKPEFGVVRQAGPQFLLLRGSIPLGHAPMKLDLAMPDPAETTALALKQIFEARGVRVTGTIRVRHAAAAGNLSGCAGGTGACASADSRGHDCVRGAYFSSAFGDCARDE